MDYTMEQREAAEQRLRARGVTPPTGVITAQTITVLDEAARRTEAPSIRTLLLALEIVTVQRDEARKEAADLLLGKWGL